MKRKVEILHLYPTGVGHHKVFEWETKKKGNMRDLVSYLMEKFQHQSLYPKGYELRPLSKGDRIRMTNLEGDAIGKETVLELVTDGSYQLLN